MSYDPTLADTSVSDWVPMASRWARRNPLMAFTVAALVGIGATILLIHTPVRPHHDVRHLHTSLQSVWIALWGFTVLLLFGKTYTSVVNYLDGEPQVDLTILPEDERHLLEPIVETPGITQQEVVDRSDFSNAKVSQTLKSLRERGLIYREPQGRTYRLYPGTVLSDPNSHS